METQFHVAIFCSEGDYAERRAFYSAIFGEAAPDGWINDGRKSHSYWGTSWDSEKLLFALLVDPLMAVSIERLAHVGFMFGSAVEFESEIKRRGVKTEQIKTYPQGQRQAFVFEPDAQPVEWEISCYEPSRL